MRDAFMRTLFERASEDKNIVFITGDLGYSVIERFAARFNKKNVTANELVMSFFQNIQGPDTYSDFVSNDLLLVSELINTLQFTENVSSGSPDKIYLVGLYILFVELEKKLKPITDAIAERDAADAKKKADYAMPRMQDLNVFGKRTNYGI